MAKVATDFEKIIQEGKRRLPDSPPPTIPLTFSSRQGRERKKNEALADRIFSKNRRQSAPSKLKATPGSSLASRVGVKKVDTPKDTKRIVKANAYSNATPTSASDLTTRLLEMSTANGLTIYTTPSQAT